MYKSNKLFSFFSKYSKYSIFPAGPFIGEYVKFIILKPSLLAKIIILCITFQANANNVVESQVQLSYKTDFTADHIIESVYTRPYNAFDNNIEYSYMV